MHDSLDLPREAAAPLCAALLETTVDCITLLDLDGCLISINGPGLVALEIDDFAGLRGQSWSSLWPDGRDEFAAAVVAAGGGGTVRFSAYGPTARGNPRWWDVCVAPIRGADGRHDRLLAVARDVTTERQLASQLRAEREFSRDALENNPHMFWIADAAGHILRVNGARLRFLGLSDDEATRTGWLKRLHPEDRAGYVDAGVRASKARGNFDHRFRLLTGDGDYRWVRSRAYPKLDDDGMIQRWYGYCEDIHDGVMAQQERVESERRLATLVRHLPGMAYRCRPEVPWHLEYASEGAEALTGYAPGDFVSGRLAWAEIVHPEDTGAISASIEAAIANGEKFSLTYRIIHRSGDVRWVLERGQPVYEDGELRCLEGFIGDISDQKRSEEQLREMQNELVHVARVSAMGSVAAGLAHELNQPLTAVSNYVSGSRKLLARHGVDAHAVIDEALHRASESAILAGTIVRSLREMVQKTEPRKAEATVADLVNNAVTLTMPDRGSRMLLRINLDPSIPTVSADRVQIQQVLVNLLRNALDAVERAPRKQIEITAAARGENELVFRVADSGPGVPAELKRELFAPFVSTKEDGMGVGLSISKTIVENHGGELWVEDAAGGGAVFSFSLPVDAS